MSALSVVRLPGPSSADKAAGIVDGFSGIWSGTVLDVGCRGGELGKALESTPVRYIGLDLYPPAEIVVDVNDGIPLPDDDVDVVVALDVLEHLESIHDGFAELCRVARRHVVIALPNCYELTARIRHLLGRELNGKYGLPMEPPADRHRWFFPLDDARRFCRHRAELASWSVASEAVLVGPNRRRIQPAIRAWPNLLSQSLVVHLVPAAT